jgi:iron(III) transport system substrate-binding protein
MGEILASQQVVIVYPDLEPDQLGTLFIPNVLAVIKGDPHREAAEALASQLLSPEVETTLAERPSVQLPLLTSTKASAKVETPKIVHAMPADFEAAAKLWDKMAAFLTDEFTGG